ncbi:uncharacterized protein LOC113147594 [Cyclospora cayetanensis]|uniref:Uncharacterized protein LOC113147594 n=1 Tax=Cyclospora cayetanensis TaxID=88456 RepID=A0A6P6S402_9EIME|nr:uncharacterized protein LOC113147594 [Cyclospora cayetanensis]
MAPWRLQMGRTKRLLDLYCGACRYRMQAPQAFSLLFQQQPELLLKSLQKGAQQRQPSSAAAQVAAATRKAAGALEATESQEAHALPPQQHTATLLPCRSREAAALALEQQQQNAIGDLPQPLARRFSLLSLASSASHVQRQAAVLRLSLAGNPLIGTRRQRGVYTPQSPSNKTASSLNSAGVACPQCGSRGKWKAPQGTSV